MTPCHECVSWYSDNLANCHWSSIGSITTLGHSLRLVYNNAFCNINFKEIVLIKGLDFSLRKHFRSIRFQIYNPNEFSLFLYVWHKMAFEQFIKDVFVNIHSWNNSQARFQIRCFEFVVKAKRQPRITPRGSASNSYDNLQARFNLCYFN